MQLGIWFVRIIITYIKDTLEFGSTWDEDKSEHKAEDADYHVELECPKNIMTYNTIGAIIYRVSHIFYLLVYLVDYC